MSRHRVKVVQSFKVLRHIVIEVEAKSLNAALDAQADSDAPPSDDPRWSAVWTLENEEVYKA